MTIMLNERNNSIMEIKLLRQTSGLTQREFSERYHIPMKTLQNWETDEVLPSARKCPPYVLYLLQKAIMEDFPVARNLLEANIDERHLAAIEHAKAKILRSPLAKYVKDVVLYGSTARGQAKPSSDVDMLMILDKTVKNYKKYQAWLTYLKGNISSDDYTMPEADLHVVFDENWNDINNAYFFNIREEGFSIWP